MLVENSKNSDVETLIRRSYESFEAGDFDAARCFLDDAHSIDFENIEVKSALRACGYWRERAFGLEKLTGDGSRGDYLRRQWNHFVDVYRKSFEHPLEEGSLRLKRWVFTEALRYYTVQAAETGDTEALLQAGRCQKALGRYEDGITTLEDALRSGGNQDSRLLSELADTYAIIGETATAKVLMREAFYLGAGSVEAGKFESPLFRRLVDRAAKERDPDDPAFSEWLPVYGTIWGVLDVKRELSPVEYGKLKQSIYALKSEIADGDEKGTLRPRLINRYFRLIDHYQTTGADRSAIDEALINIKLLSPVIYRTYFE